MLREWMNENNLYVDDLFFIGMGIAAILVYLIG